LPEVSALLSSVLAATDADGQCASSEKQISTVNMRRVQFSCKRITCLYRETVKSVFGVYDLTSFFSFLKMNI